MTRNLITNALQPRPVALEAPPIAAPVAAPAPTKPQASRVGMKAITVYHPEIVHRTLKIIAAEEGRTVEDLTAEAFNLLFRTYRKAEVARGGDAT